MKTTLKRLFSLLLVLVMLGSMLPAVYADDASGSAAPVELTDEDYAIVDDVFAKIDAMENEPAKKSATETQLADAAAQIVAASDNFVEGSLERNGNSFTWWTEKGIRCVYSPRMREIESEMVAPETPLADGAYNEPVATKGGWPSSNQVYLIAPYYGYDDSFSDQYKNEATSIASAIGDTDGYTLYSGKAATIDTVATAMSNGAVVIFDSHGSTDYENGYDYVTGANYSYLCMKSTSGLTTEDYNDGALYYSDGIWITGASIANHMTKQSPGGLLWMAICLGMATDTFAVPMREMGVEVVYGYSQSVTFDGDYMWEEIFWDNMCAGTNVATAIADMKSKCGEWDYCTKMYSYAGWSADEYGPITSISSARSNYSAFPIVVSDEDSHPGQRSGTSNYGADSLQTVKSTYTLFSQYEVTAQSNNTSWGTVAASGNVITATPATGYFAQGYTVTSGSATVSQNGNTFTVNASSDCTVQINFAAKTAVTVSFSGANVASQGGYAGDSMTLPTAEAPEGYKFLGWMTAPLSDDTTEKPNYYTDSFIPTGNITLYALYSYVDENSGSGTGDYVKVTESRDDWSGEYVIVYEADGYIFNGSLDSFDATSNYKAVTITDETISASEADPYKFTIAAVDGGYSIQGTSGNYIGHNSNANGLTTSADALVNTISLDASGNANIIGNGGAHLRYNATSNQWRFRYYKSSSYSNQKAIALYLKDGTAGTTYYTTNLCDHENTVDVEAVAATCTQSGYTAGVQCSDCGSYISGHQVVDALGHSYGDWTVTTAPGCETAGEQTSTCATCGETETQAVAATGHNLDSGSVTTAATCTADGVMTYTCSACGKTTTEVIPATGHSYADGVCSACGEAEPEVSKDRFYIAALRNDVYFYMTSDLGTSSTKRYQAVDTNLSELPETITNPETGYVFVLIDNGDGTYSLQAEGVDGNNYLGWTSGNSGTLVAESSALKLTVDVTDGIYNIHFAASDAERYLSLNGTAGNNYFAWYKSGQIQDLVLIPVGGSFEPDISEPEVTEPEATEPEVTEPEVTEPEATEPEVTEPAGSATTLQYVFSDYTAGTQYAEGENHILDDVVTLTINKAHLNSQIRLYAGSNAVFTSTKEIDSIIVKAGYKSDTLNIYSSADGSTWNLVAAQATTTSYTNYSFDIPDGSYYVKLESVGAQIRVSEMSITVLESGSTEPEVTEPEITEPEVTEPEVTEPEVTEPEVTQPVAGAEVTIDFSTTDQRVSLDNNSQVWANNGATLTNNKASSSSNVADYSNPVRFYKGSEIIIAFPGMNKIEVNCNTAGYAADLAASIADSNATVTQSGSKVTIEFTNAVDEISFTLTAQVRVNNLTVYREATCDHEYTSVVTAPTCTTAGYTTYTCGTCGDSYTADEVAALGHSYVLSGTTYTCSVCGDSYDIFYVSFSVPNGVAAVEKIEYTAGGIELPSAGAPEGYTFIGWTEATVDNSTDKPTFYAAGSVYEAEAAVTLKAVYSYVVGNESSGNYVKVTEAPADWSGEYLIVYEPDETTGYIFNGSLDSLDAVNNYKEVTISGNTISAADGDSYKFIISAKDGSYTIQSISGLYVGRTATSNGLNASTSTVYTNTLGLDSFGHAVITCEGGTQLKFNATSGQNRFRYYGTGQKNIELYVKTSGTTFYTTEIGEKKIVESWNISLGDNIAVNFVMNVEDTDQVSFTVAGNAVEAMKNGNTYSIYLAAAQMTDEIVICVNGEAVEDTYSVREYADVILSGEYDEAVKNLVNAMLCYGGAAQTFFDYNTGSMANDGIEMTAEAPTGDTAVAVTDNVDGLDFYGASLVHRNKTAVRFYFSGSIEGLTFSQGTAVQKGEMYYIEIADINPQQIGDAIEITVTDEGGNTLTVGYSPLTYIVRMYEKADSSESAKALVLALYNYYLAAQAYTN